MLGLMRANNAAPNEVTFYTLIKLYGSLREWDNATAIIAQMRQLNIAPTVEVYSHLMWAACQCEKYEMCLKIFEAMQAASMVPWKHARTHTRARTPLADMHARTRARTPAHTTCTRTLAHTHAHSRTHSRARTHTRTGAKHVWRTASSARARAAGCTGERGSGVCCGAEEDTDVQGDADAVPRAAGRARAAGCAHTRAHARAHTRR